MALAVARKNSTAEAAQKAKGWENLAAALQQEARLLDELRGVLMRQRSNIAQNDPGAIEDSVEAMGRTLHTLQEARQKRTTLIKLMTGGEGQSLNDVPRLLCDPVPAVVKAAQERSRQAASNVAREAAINQHVIKRSLDAGEAFIQRLFCDEGDGRPVYDPADGNSDAKQSAMLINRRA